MVSTVFLTEFETFCTPYQDKAFNPIIETMSVVKKNNLQKVAGSLNMNIPISTAPTAPIPVHTGYAVPKGIVCVAFARKTALNTYKTANATIHIHHSVPATPFARPRQYVKPTSQSPATIKIIQFTLRSFP